MKKGKRDRETQTPAANAAGRKRGNMPGSQRGGRGANEPLAGLGSGGYPTAEAGDRRFVCRGLTCLTSGSSETPIR
jgi:hypothetical protein